MRKPARPAPLSGLPLLEDLPEVEGRDVLVRVDFNTPLAEADDGSPVVADDFRIRTALPTLRWLVDRGARVTARSHLGRPSVAGDPRCSMAPVGRRLAELCPEVRLGDNLRFEPGEKGNDPAFVDRLVAGFDCYVNEAFGVSHRAHASVVGPPRRLPSAAGRRLAEEVAVLGALLGEPERPFVAVVGGAKVGDKIGVLRALGEHVDTLVVGGAMAFTFLAAAGHDVGDSFADPGRIVECRDLMASGIDLVVPTDVVALAPGGAFAPGSPPPTGRGREPDADLGEVRVVGVDVPTGWKGLDIGPESAGAFAAAVGGAGTVLWNGPVGAFEDPRFAAGTRRVAEAVADCPGFTVVGGGDSANALDQLGVAERVDFVSTGGGASLELIEHGDLPGLAALRAGVDAPVRS